MDTDKIRICNACGAEASLTGRFCPKCGSLSLGEPQRRAPIIESPPLLDVVKSDDEDDWEDDDEDAEELTPLQRAERLLGPESAGPPLEEGVPSCYECWGTSSHKFTIEYSRWAAPAARWTLSLNEQTLGGYKDEIAAMQAVFGFETGHPPWDSLKGQVNPPKNTEDWSSRQFL